MNLSPSELETLLLFLAQHHAMFAATCKDMQTDPDSIAQALCAEHRASLPKIGA